MSSLIRQKYLRKDYVTRLKAEVSRNLAYYERNEPWIATYSDGQPFELESGLTRPAQLDLHLPDRSTRDLKDFENACVIHEAFRNLNPAQASDPRLWTHLTHVDCWEYMRHRWPIPDKEKKDDAKRSSFIRSHYFVETYASRSFTRNGIAGLWWFAHLTYDPNRVEPYELTSTLLKKLDVTKNFIERNLGRNQNILRGFLELLAEDQAAAEQVGGGEHGRIAVRVLSRQLNAYGGVALLDQLDKAEVKDLIRRCMDTATSNDSVNIENDPSDSEDDLDMQSNDQSAV